MISLIKHLNQGLDANRRASYLAGMSRSVGRGWPYGHFLPDSIKIVRPLAQALIAAGSTTTSFSTIMVLIVFLL